MIYVVIKSLVCAVERSFLLRKSFSQSLFSIWYEIFVEAKLSLARLVQLSQRNTASLAQHTRHNGGVLRQVTAYLGEQFRAQKVCIAVFKGLTKISYRSELMVVILA